MSRTVEMVGKTFGRWKVLSRSGSTSRGQATWRCECACGVNSVVRGADLRNGTSVSCGCYREEVVTTHGQFIGQRGRQSPEYRAWAMMLNRCTSKKEHLFRYYGGRGIKVCNRWLSFANFFKDMGRRPSAEHSVDRIDNDGDYEPENCRWATDMQQSRNRRSNKWLTHDGVTLCLRDWSRRVGIHYNTIHGRLCCGWTVAEALTTPVAKKTRR